MAANIVGPATPGSVGALVKENLSGVVDGSNTVFGTSAAFIAGTTQVYLNGLLLDILDYIEASSSVIFDQAPLAGDRLTIIYIEESA